MSETDNCKDRLNDKFKAVILCGGEGKRMRPLTAKTPKPLLKIGKKTIIERILDNLSADGVGECILTLGIKHSGIKTYIGDKYKGMDITAVTENVPLGSAGGVKAAESMLGEFFILLCGDAYYSFSLLPAIELLQSKNADCVIVTSESDNPLEFGIVCAGSDGRVKAFVEKPSWSGVVGNDVNTGMYIFRRTVLDIIPENTKCDFGRDVFPEMVKRNMGIYAFKAKGLWRDVGNPASYHECNMLSSGGVNVIGDNCRISPYCEISESVILDNVSVSESSMITGSIICRNCEIGADVKISRHSVIGEGSVLGDGCVIGKGVILPCGTHIRPFAVIENPLASSEIFSVRAAYFIGECREKLSRLGAALVSAFGGSMKIAVSYERGIPSLRSRAMNFVSGICRESENIYIIGGMSYGEARFNAMSGKYDLTAFLRYSGDGTQICFFDKNGVYPGARFESAVRYASAFSPFSSSDSIKRPVVVSDNTAYLFGEALKKEISSDISQFRVCLLENENHPLYGFLKYYDILSDENNADIVIKPHDDGAEIIYDGVFFDEEHVRAVCLLEYLRKGTKNILLPYRSPYVLRDMVLSCKATLSLFSLSPYDEREEDKIKLFSSVIGLYDGSFSAVLFLNYCSVMSLSGFGLYSLLPEFSSKTDLIYLPENLKMSFLTNRENDGEGFILRNRRGRIRIIPENGSVLAVSTESGDIGDASALIEAAKKYVDDYTKRNEITNE